MPVVSFTVFPVSVLKTLQVTRCTWWGLAFPSTRGKQSKSVTSEKVLALRGFECGGVSIWVLTSPHRRGWVQPLRGRRESMRRFRLPLVQLASSRRRCRSLPAGFKGLGLMSPYQHRISSLEGMRAGNGVVCTVCGGYRFPDFLLHQLQGLQMGLPLGLVLGPRLSRSRTSPQM